MAVNHTSIATHIPQSLPSFAQAFSHQSLGSISTGNNSLPPIQTRLPPLESRRVATPSSRPSSEDSSSSSKTNSRKRSRNDVTPNTREEHRSNSDASPRLVHIKEEQDQEMLDVTPVPPPPPPRLDIDTTGAPPPSSVRPSPSKKRRVTISGAPHPLNTDVRVPVDQTNSTPISPVVMGFTIKRDNPSAIEQVKSMITVKQKQKALIEQRRGSVVGVMSPTVTAANTPNHTTPPEERNPTSSKASGSTRPQRRSPNNGNTRKPANNPSLNSSNTAPASPSPIIVVPTVTQQSAPPPPNPVTNTHSLPPPPISFARRRAEQLGSGKKKPADIVISPREAHTQEQFQPAIQSAPPIPHAAQQGAFFSGRFPMALPRLPSVMGGGDNVRRVAINVPPTPTRLSMQRNAPSGSQTIPRRSPPAASVPIASTLVPPTPGLFHRPGYAGDKAAFLAPFEVFYEALNDSKQLKGWLSEQLQRSNVMMQQLTQQQEKLSEVVDALVEKQVAPVRSEMAGLCRRIEELEDALRMATSGRRHSSTDVTAVTGTKSKGSKALHNGVTGSPMAPDSYTFPPVAPTPNSLEPSLSRSKRPEPIRRPSSPGSRGSDSQPAADMDIGSPAPLGFDSRLNLTYSRSHLELPSQAPARMSPRLPFSAQAPVQPLREPSGHSAPSPRPHGRPLPERPSLSRQTSGHGAGTGEGQPQNSPSLRREESRRNSVIMSPPDAPGEDAP